MVQIQKQTNIINWIATGTFIQLKTKMYILE